jgi:hypothetical protein
MLVRYVTPAALLLLSACAAAVPGYTPPPFKEPSSALAKPMVSGDVRGDGQYEMSSEEKARDCKHITGAMQISIARMKDSYGRAEPSAGAKAAQTAMTPVLGGTSVGADRQAVHARERAKLEAYNRELAAKGCKTLDIEAELARPPDPAGKRY